MIVVDCAAVVDALTAVEGSDDLRAFMVSEELNAPALLDLDSWPLFGDSPFAETSPPRGRKTR